MLLPVLLPRETDEILGDKFGYLRNIGFIFTSEILWIGGFVTVAAAAAAAAAATVVVSDGDGDGDGVEDFEEGPLLLFNRKWNCFDAGAHVDSRSDKTSSL